MTITSSCLAFDEHEEEPSCHLVLRSRKYACKLIRFIERWNKSAKSHEMSLILYSILLYFMLFYVLYLLKTFVLHANTSNKRMMAQMFSLYCLNFLYLQRIEIKDQRIDFVPIYLTYMSFKYLNYIL
jgi:hypothetical protein